MSGHQLHKTDRDRIVVLILRALLALALLGVWQFGSGRFLDPFYFSSPLAVVKHLGVEFVTPGFWNDLRITGIELLLGFLFGAGAGVLVAMILGRWRVLNEVLNPFFVALNSIPRIALGPLLVIWFGIDLTSKVVLAASLVFFITFFNTLAGVQNVDAGLISVARVQGASNCQIFLKVILPSSVLWIMTGLKTSLPFALIGVIVGEFLASAAGLGYRLNLYSTSYNTTGTMAMLVVLMVVMLFLNACMDLLERRVLRWRPQSGFEAGRASP